jgi:hypothetical protein
LPSSLQSPAATHVPPKFYGIQMAGVSPDTGVGSLIRSLTGFNLIT